MVVKVFVVERNKRGCARQKGNRKTGDYDWLHETTCFPNFDAHDGISGIIHSYEQWLREMIVLSIKT